MGCLAASGDITGCYNSGFPLASPGCRPEMLINTPQCTAQLPLRSIQPTRWGTREISLLLPFFLALEATWTTPQLLSLKTLLWDAHLRSGQTEESNGEVTSSKVRDSPRMAVPTPTPVPSFFPLSYSVLRCWPVAPLKSNERERECQKQSCKPFPPEERT